MNVSKQRQTRGTHACPSPRERVASRTSAARVKKWDPILKKKQTWVTKNAVVLLKYCEIDRLCAAVSKSSINLWLFKDLKHLDTHYSSPKETKNTWYHQQTVRWTPGSFHRTWPCWGQIQHYGHSPLKCTPDSAPEARPPENDHEQGGWALKNGNIKMVVGWDSMGFRGEIDFRNHWTFGSPVFRQADAAVWKEKHVLRNLKVDYGMNQN